MLWYDYVQDHTRWAKAGGWVNKATDRFYTALYHPAKASSIWKGLNYATTHVCTPKEYLDQSNQLHYVNVLVRFERIIERNPIISREAHLNEHRDPTAKDTVRNSIWRNYDIYLVRQKTTTNSNTIHHCVHSLSLSLCLVFIWNSHRYLALLRWCSQKIYDKSKIT